MDPIGSRLGILCVALILLLSACAGSEAASPDLRTPPARDTGTGQVGDLADRGADGVSAP